MKDSALRPLLDALARVLRPLVRLLIARGVHYQMASELLKRVYVDAARRDFAGDAPTATQLSLLTGLNRKEIRRLTTEAEADKRPESMMSYAAATWAEWRSTRRWRDRDGHPKPLPRKTEGRRAGFDDLVRSITQDHRPSAVFDELMRLGAIAEDADGNVRLIEPAFTSGKSFGDRMYFFGENLEDHAAAAVANVLADAPPFLERAVFSDELSAQSVEALTVAAQRQWRTLHDGIVEQAIALEAADIEAGRVRDRRFRVGIYVFSDTRDIS
ncbi:MAG: hypothetical protein JNK75_15245 [Betaproteobacteria bacterium]|nr:hypothetical protein [Betaproteobacteria bacterium]